MKKIWLSCLVAGLVTGIVCLFNYRDSKAILCVKKPSDLAKLFPKTVAQIKNAESLNLKKIDLVTNQILKLPKDQYNFANIMQPLDDLRLDVGAFLSAMAILQYLSPDNEIRTQAQITSLTVSQDLTRKINLNKSLYLVLKDYINNALSNQNTTELLTPEQIYHLKTTLADYKRSGLDLPEYQLEQITLITDETTKLGQQYLANLGSDQTKITVTKAELTGVDHDFIASLKTDTTGKLILNCDDNSYLKVMANCTVTQTRESFYRARTKRAYPQNLEILKELVQKRDELAQILGFASYAHLDLDDQMVLSPEKAEEFLLELLPTVQAKAKLELEEFKKDLPASVTLVDGKIQPWDMMFIKNQYKRKYLEVDEQQISEYFMQSETVASLLKIYENFLGLRFETVTTPKLWASQDELTVLAAYNKNTNQLLGYLILDLFIRANKLPHAGAQISVIPAILGYKCSAVAVVFTNFNPAQKDKPALLTYDQVRTFFHEFGHAMHTLLGATALAAHSGTNVKTDFVEMPSQMLECWLSEPQILAQISKHYQTGLPLPTELITKLIRAQKFDNGDKTLRQINLALLSLAVYAPGSTKDFIKLNAQLNQKIYDYMIYDPENMLLAAFLHITTYGAKYYGYLWSQVFANDIFAHIKDAGLDNPTTGQYYIEHILGKGGSCEPETLLINFLGRKPNQEAFKRELGF